MKQNKRLLITGGSGLLGLNWAICMRDQFQVVLGLHEQRVNLAGTESLTLDFADEKLLAQQINDFSPQVIVHAAGLTNIERCEQDKTLAEAVNALAAEKIARIAATLKISLIHISTDHLFSGDKSFYREDDTPNPQNAYAKTKALAESLVLAEHPDALVIRTNFFGWGHTKRQSFSDWIIYNLRLSKPLTLFEDVFFTPILADTLAVAAHELLEKGAKGIFNVVGDERLSKYTFALLVCQQFNLPQSLLEPNKISQMPSLVTRPLDMSLSNDKSQKWLGRKLGFVSGFLKQLADQEIAGRQKELFESVG